MAMIWLSEYFDFFMQNLLRIGYEKILLLTSIIFRGDYRATDAIILGVLFAPKKMARLGKVRGRAWPRKLRV
jgi:hypothetical protein